VEDATTNSCLSAQAGTRETHDVIPETAVLVELLSPKVVAEGAAAGMAYFECMLLSPCH
jgi:hypothetical protein